MNDEKKNELIASQDVPVNPFAHNLPEHVNAGAVSIESSRAVAEAQGKLEIIQRSRKGLFNTSKYPYYR